VGSLSVLWLLVFVSSQKSVKIRLWYKCYFSVDNDFAVDIPAGHSLFSISHIADRNVHTDLTRQ